MLRPLLRAENPEPQPVAEAVRPMPMDVFETAAPSPPRTPQQIHAKMLSDKAAQRRRITNRESAVRSRLRGAMKVSALHAELDSLRQTLAAAAQETQCLRQELGCLRQSLAMSRKDAEYWHDQAVFYADATALPPFNAAPSLFSSLDAWPEQVDLEAMIFATSALSHEEAAHPAQTRSDS